MTAIETAATQQQIETGEPTKLVEDLWPDLWAHLRNADDSVRTGVAKQLGPQMKATQRFIEFMGKYSPAPPESRPEHNQLDWSKLRTHARIIYGHRSTALHGGKPFPLPMLEESAVEESGAVQEVPFGLNSAGQGGVWDKEDAPMLLSTFEHMARGALLSWWDELASS